MEGLGPLKRKKQWYRDPGCLGGQEHVDSLTNNVILCELKTAFTIENSHLCF